VTLAEHERQPDMKRLRAYRLARVQAELRKHDYAGGFFCDPLQRPLRDGHAQHVGVDVARPARYCFVRRKARRSCSSFAAASISRTASRRSVNAALSSAGTT
jgi:hypothetical protein